MARYDRRSMRHGKPVEGLDPDSQEYWEAILRREGLAMSRGLRPNKLSYHGPKELEKIAAARQCAEADEE